MSADIPTWEPQRISAGDRWLWERQDLSDYPAGTWTLTYALSKTDKLITLTATASGTYHRIDVTAATTAAYPSGRYSWAAYVTSGSDRREIGRGEIEVRPNLATQTNGLDTRGFAQRMVEAIEAELLGKASAHQLDLVSMTINARNLQRSPETLIKLRDYFKAEAKAESIRDRLDSGMSGAPRLLVRM